MTTPVTALRPLLTCLLVFVGVSACGGASFNETGGGNGGGGDDAPVIAVAALVLLDESGSADAELPGNAVNPEDGITLVARARDAQNRLLSGVPVRFAATSGALQVIDAQTNDAGEARAVLTTGGDGSPRQITVIVEAGEQQSQMIVRVVEAVVPIPPDFRLGANVDGEFVPGAIAIGQSPLAAGGSSGLSLRLVDVNNDNAAFPGDVLVTFDSDCIDRGLAEVTPNPAPNSGGNISATYVASGCPGEDAISAVAVVDGETLRANGTIVVEPAALGGIEFVDADPDFIGLPGSGRQESSRLTFRVRDASGGPLVGQLVTFALNTTVGGISLTPVEGTTDDNGEVQTVVSAGTVSTAVRVTATVSRDGQEIRSQSDQLIISTGIPDNDSFSLSAECFNIEGWAIDGTESELTLRAADRFNNPVPDGTQIFFTTEGGSVDPGCSTVGGVCSVTWRSQDPRPGPFNGCGGPAGSKGSDADCAIGGNLGAARPGRSTVLATAVGEESFTDLNGNGIFDDGEPFEDLAEAFRDDDGDGVRDGFEEFRDFNNNANFDAADGQFNGALCAPDAMECAPEGQRSLFVRRDVTIILSDSQPVIAGGDITVSGASFDGSTVTLDAGDTAVIVFVIRDLNDQPMPAGTSVAATFDGEGAELVGTSNFDVLCTTNDTAAGNSFGFAVRGDDIDPGEADGGGLFELSVTSPGGTNSIFTLGVRVVAPPPPPPPPPPPGGGGGGGTTTGP